MKRKKPMQRRRRTRRESGELKRKDYEKEL